jgi:plasmid stabilization system protein ParE
LKPYTLSYLPIFDVDLAEAWRYIAIRLRNPEAADRLVMDTEKAILKRLEAPESFEQYHSEKERLYPYYRINIRNFTIWYVVVDNVMEVRRLLYSKRNLEELL